MRQIVPLYDAAELVGVKEEIEGLFCAHFEKISRGFGGNYVLNCICSTDLLKSFEARDQNASAKEFGAAANRVSRR